MNRKEMNVYIGTDKDLRYGCLLYTEKSFDELRSHVDWLNGEHFYMTSGWNGMLEVEELLKGRKLKLTGRSFDVPQGLRFSGVDYDMGKKYPWRVSYGVVAEVEPV